ncbi:hypothetical protein Lreu23DRAFT_4495 [Limosilactobacillus reuteri subsp. rodentium]|uniref:Uncharacterized protein n=1 Tax=Limosilactobacillus reuteri subsp. rodentium (strain DSM 17509 / CIP 109821 / 100-23) TaxID=349123 RepID=B3XPX5_LIMR1|nr:hypothetical protein Lreu23DRAFT_4495 [Limosilactobacillus reuteri subsp. rodentium]
MVTVVVLRLSQFAEEHGYSHHDEIAVFVDYEPSESL